MNLLDAVNWRKRVVGELRGIRQALERIANDVNAAVGPDLATHATFRSGSADDAPDDSDISYLDDEDRAEMERRELEDIARGGPAIPGFYEGEDDRAASVVGPTVKEQIDRETEGES